MTPCGFRSDGAAVWTQNHFHSTGNRAGSIATDGFRVGAGNGCGLDGASGQFPKLGFPRDARDDSLDAITLGTKPLALLLDEFARRFDSLGITKGELLFRFHCG
jgi:hypothetical protein